jgi:hypothetical protein
MKPDDEYAFLRNFSSAMRLSEDVSALNRLWSGYEDTIAALSKEGQVELERLRVARSRELMNERTKQ